MAWSLSKSKYRSSKSKALDKSRKIAPVSSPSSAVENTSLVNLSKAVAVE